MSWIGRKKLAVIPVYQPDASPPDVIPVDWMNQIMGRFFFNPDAVLNGRDISLRRYIQAISSGLADFDAVVMPMRTVNGQDFSPEDLEGQIGPQLRSQGFDAAVTVGFRGPFFQVGTGSFWLGVVMEPAGFPEPLDKLGLWADSFIDSLTPIKLYGGYLGNIPRWGTHPCAYAKAALGWLDASAIAQHSGFSAGYDLHSVGLVQPPPPGRSTAVRIGSQSPYIMVEARQWVDQFAGFLDSGVICYQVQAALNLDNDAALALLTTQPLAVGQTFTSGTGVTVQVIKDLPGGYSISVHTQVIVPDVVEVSPEIATARVQAAGLVPKFMGPNLPHSWVSSQSPAAGQAVPYSSTVTMHLHSGPLPP